MLWWIIPRRWALCSPGENWLTLKLCSPQGYFNWLYLTEIKTYYFFYFKTISELASCCLFIYVLKNYLRLSFYIIKVSWALRKSPEFSLKEEKLHFKGLMWNVDRVKSVSVLLMDHFSFANPFWVFEKSLYSYSNLGHGKLKIKP